MKTETPEGKIVRSYLVEVIVEDDQDEDGNAGFHAYCPALIGCHTEGNTYEEALANVGDAVLAYLSSLIKHGEPIPLSPLNSGLPSVSVVKSPAVYVNVA